jgi:hypothetical protein
VAPGRPNVILIITDDQGYGDIGAHGNWRRGGDGNVPLRRQRDVSGRARGWAWLTDSKGKTRGAYFVYVRRLE